jgi:hypothetical protein
MDDAKFDRLARASGKTVSRRWLLALLVTVLNMLSQRVARGSQLGPGTCNEQGAVCTLLSGCCDGLTCATSSINTSYGICVPGEGGMVSTGPTLISPFSDTAVQELAPLVQTAATAPTADPRPDRKERLAEIKARKDAKRTEEKTRLRAKRDAKKIREQERHNRRLEARGRAREALGPHLEFELRLPGGLTGTETLTVRNLDDADVLLVKIESVLHPDDNNQTNRTVRPGGSFNYYSGITDDISNPTEQAWINLEICSGDAGAGFKVTVGATSNSLNQQHVVLCDGPSLIRVNEPRQAARTHKRKRKNDQHKKKKR